MSWVLRWKITHPLSFIPTKSTRFGGGGSSTTTRQQGQQQHQQQRRFHHALFAVLLRYSSLAGGTDRGGGFQGAINEEVGLSYLKLFIC
jgi:hypothetical protein